MSKHIITLFPQNIFLGIYSHLSNKRGAKNYPLHKMMPIMYIKAITQDKQEHRNLYECLIYKTRQRGPTYIWTFNLKTKEKASKWILAGVALLLQI